MMTSLLRKIAILSVVGFLTSSCGGGGGGGDVAGGGLSGSGISAGAITSFGSIFVNGVEFDTAGATITLDDTPVSESDLKIGMVVKVKGTFGSTSGSAVSVEAEDVVKGLVQNVAVDGLSLVVLGQKVLIDGNTVIDNNTLGGDVHNLTPGTDVVEVHGFVKGDGIIGATFIERKAPAEFRVTGFAKNIDIGGKTFDIGTLTVQYGGADTSDLPGGNPVADQLLEIKGQNALVGGELIATKIEPAGLGLVDAPEAEVEGFVTAVTSLVPVAEFFIGSQRIVTTGSTTFSGGLQDDIVVGVKLEAEGSLSGGTFTANKISFRDSVKLESDVDIVGASSFSLRGLTGVLVTVDSNTEFKNVASLSGITSGNHLRVRGRVDSGSTVIATEIELRSTDTDVVLQSPVDALPAPADPTFVVLGVTVDTTGIPDTNFQGIEDTPIGRAAFFATIAPGKLVKAQGTLSGTSVTWQEVELED